MWEREVGLGKYYQSLAYNLSFLVLIQQEHLLQDWLPQKQLKTKMDRVKLYFSLACGARYGLNDVPLGGNLFDHGPGTLSKYPGFSPGYISFTSISIIKIKAHSAKAPVGHLDFVW